MEIYLDHNASTPIDEEVVEAMLPYFTSNYANASSHLHFSGRQAAKAVEQAREKIAALIQSDSSEIIFTSGATESINIAIQGLAANYASHAKHIITASTEHKAVLDTCKNLEKKGFSIDILPVNQQGEIDTEQLNALIKDDTFLVCIMLANNETGMIQDLPKISKIVHERGKILMSDATTCIGKMKVNVQELGIDIMPLSAHKFYGPKGVGALYLRRKNPRITIQGILQGGGHEKNIRPGSYNVPGIVGMGKAASIVSQNCSRWENDIRQNRNLLESEIEKLTPIFINSKENLRLCNTSNITFENLDAQNLIKFAYGKLALATGSACTSALPQPSHVLKAMGLSDKQAKNSVRFSLGKTTTKENILNATLILKDFLKC